MIEKLFKIIGAALYSTFVEPVYGIIMGQDGMRMIIALVFLVTGALSFINPDRAFPYMTLYLSSVMFCAIFSVWIVDPFIFVFSNILELGWLLYLIPSGLMALTGLFMPGNAFYILALSLVCYIVSSVLRTVLNYRAGEKEDAAEKKERRKRKFGRVCVSDDKLDFSSLFEGLTVKEAKKRYTSLMKEHHPDNGGDMNIAQEINIAFQKYRKCV